MATEALPKPVRRASVPVVCLRAVSSIDDVVIHQFPFPVAERWSAWSRRLEPRADETYRVAEALVRLVAVFGLADWLRTSGAASFDWMHLTDPGFGTYAHHVNDLVGALLSECDAGFQPFIPELLEWRATKRRGESSPKAVADTLVQLRNRWNHDFTAFDSDNERSAVRVAAVELRALAGKLMWLADYRLVTVPSARRDFSGLVTGQLKMLVGHAARPAHVSPVDVRWRGHLDRDDHRVMLLDAKGEQVLDLTPLVEVRATGARPRVWVWRKFEGGKGKPVGAVELEDVESSEARRFKNGPAEDVVMWPEVIAARPDRARLLALDVPDGAAVPGVALQRSGGRLEERYELGRLLGRGGMGEVFLARDKKAGRDVAIKLLPAQLDDAEHRERFEREVRIAAGLLAAPHVVPFLAFGRGAETYLVMPYYARGSLEPFTRDRGQPADVARWVAETATALAAIHDRGVVHRDIKPANLLLDDDGSVRVTDFGLAMGAELTRLTRTQARLGTLFYMAPEQYSDSSRVDGKADVFSLAVVWSHLLSPLPPGLPCKAWWQQLRTLAKALDPWGPLMTEMLSMSPSKRPTAGEVASAIHGVQKPASVGARLAAVAPGAALVCVPAGTFQMGQESSAWDGERPVHPVTITRPFELWSTPVTQAQWKELMGNSPPRFSGDTRPVECVSWYDAVAFCNVLSRALGLEEAYALTSVKGTPGTEGYEAIVAWKGLGCPGFRLPTEAEWEYACRSGTTGERYGELDAVAWHRGNSGSETHPVGKKQPNAWGLYDTIGNVWEWVWDWKGSYSPGDQCDPAGPATGARRVGRGGGWYRGAGDARAACRFGDDPGYRCDVLGFRPSRSLP